MANLRLSDPSGIPLFFVIIQPVLLIASAAFAAPTTAPSSDVAELQAMTVRQQAQIARLQDELAVLSAKLKAAPTVPATSPSAKAKAAEATLMDLRGMTLQQESNALKSEFKQIPNYGEDARDIQKWMTVLTDREANETDVFVRVKKGAIIHFSTTVIFQEDIPFAPPPR